MKLNKGNILIETLLALMVLMIITNTIVGFKRLDLVKHNIVNQYEKGL